jgi:hypothetical protein
MTEQTAPMDGSNVLFRDSKFGLAAAGVVTVVVDGVINGVLEGAANVDTSGWHGWWVSLASAALGIGVGALTSYKAKRASARATRGY